LATLTAPSANSATGNCSPEAKLSFTDLVELLSAQTAPPTLKQLYTWLENSNISDEDLQPYLGFKDGTYWRHLVCRNEAVEMLVLCWKPGHRTVIHDHNGSVGAVYVQSGVVWETMFSFDEEKGLRYHSINEHQTGALTGADVPDIHQLGNPDVSEKNLVTIHVYSPPVGAVDGLFGGRVQRPRQFREQRLLRVVPVVVLDGVADGLGGTLELVGDVPQGIRRGQTLQIRLAFSDEVEAVQVAKGGFYQQTGGNWIFKVADNGKIAYKVDIQLGRQNPDYYEVLEGLKPGDKVVTSSYENYGNMQELVLNK